MPHFSALHAVNHGEIQKALRRRRGRLAVSNGPASTARGTVKVPLRHAQTVTAQPDESHFPTRRIPITFRELPV
ncbi:MAG TPA: hypothetical protein VFG62_25550, partial [Rhodopila sp.]|nr:hypothetical protein [Rhodopila sp.]